MMILLRKLYKIEDFLNYPPKADRYLWYLESHQILYFHKEITYLLVTATRNILHLFSFIWKIICNQASSITIIY